MILDYLNQTNQANPEAAKRAKELLDRGYGRLTSFECPDTPAQDQARLRVVRRGRHAARGADRLRPAAVQGHGPRPPGRSASSSSGRRRSCSRAATARAASSRTPARSTFVGGLEARHQRLHRLGPGRERPGRHGAAGPQEGDRRAQGRGAERELRRRQGRVLRGAGRQRPAPARRPRGRPPAARPPPGEAHEGRPR